MLEYVRCRTSKAPGQPPQQINVDRFVRSPECVARIDDICGLRKKRAICRATSRAAPGWRDIVRLAYSYLTIILVN